MPLPVRPPSDPNEEPQARTASLPEALPAEDSLALPEIDFSSFGAAERDPEEAPAALPQFDEAELGLPELSFDELSSAAPEPVAEPLSVPEEENFSEDDFEALFDEPQETPASVEEPSSENEWEDFDVPEVAPLPEVASASPQGEEDFDWDDFEIDEAAPPAPVESQEKSIEQEIDDLFGDDFDSEPPAALPAPEQDWEALPAPEAPAPLPLPEPEESWDDFEIDEAPSAQKIDDDMLNELFADEESEFDDSPPRREEAAPAPKEESWDEDFDAFMEDLDKEPAPDEEPQGEEEYVSTFDQPEEEEIEPEEALKPLKKSDKGKKKPKKGKGKKGPSKLLQRLASIPLLGLLFKPLLLLGSLGSLILALVPVVGLLVILLFVVNGSVPGGNSVTGPDGAAASISDFSYSEGNVTAVVTNSGEVVANVVPELTVWSYNPFAGGSLLAFDKVATCTGEEISVDIDAEATASVACEAPAGGLMTRYSGTISF